MSKGPYSTAPERRAQRVSRGCTENSTWIRERPAHVRRREAISPAQLHQPPSGRVRMAWSAQPGMRRWMGKGWVERVSTAIRALGS